MKTWTDDAKAHVNRYLRQVQVRLEGSGADAHEVVEDLSRHIHQQANDSPHVVITIEEAKHILAAMGTPDEVALSWKQLGTGAEVDAWDSPTPNPSTARQMVSPRWLWPVLGAVVVLAAALIAYVSISLVVAPAKRTEDVQPSNLAGERIDAARPERGAPEETRGRWESGWFQAGNNLTDYVTGSASGVDGIKNAMFIRAPRPNATGFSTVMTQVAADAYRGERVRLTGNVKSELETGTAGMWMRIDGLDGSTLGFDNMNDRPIEGRTPVTAYTIELDVPEEAVNIAYGVLFSGQGAVWFGDMVLASRGPARAAPPEAAPSANLPASWFQAGSNHTDYQTGSTSVEGIPGQAMYIQSVSPNPTGFSTIMTEISAARYRGTKVTLTGTIRSDIRSGWGGMWLRIDGPQGEALGFDNMQDRPITGTTPATAYTITLEVPGNAAELAFGVLFQGEGAVYSSEPELQ